MGLHDLQPSAPATGPPRQGRSAGRDAARGSSIATHGRAAWLDGGNMTPASMDGEAAVDTDSAANTSSHIAKTIITVKEPCSATTSIVAALLILLRSHNAPSTADSSSESSHDGAITRSMLGRVLGVGPHTPNASRLEPGRSCGKHPRGGAADPRVAPGAIPRCRAATWPPLEWNTVRHGTRLGVGRTGLPAPARSPTRPSGFRSRAPMPPFADPPPSWRSPRGTCP